MAENTIDKTSNVIITVMFVSIFLVVMILAVVLIIGAVSVANLSLFGTTSVTGTALNETHLANYAGSSFVLTNAVVNGYTTTCSNHFIINQSNGVVITLGNWTVDATTGCIVSVVSPGYFNNTAWNVSYIYTYDITNSTGINPALTGITTNVVSMVVNFFALMPTIGTILAVVVLIAGIIILVFYVRRMKGSEQSEGSYTG